MIAGGACRGFIRARRIAERYVLAYLAIGLVLIFSITPFLARGDFWFEAASYLAFAHFWLAGFLFPMALAANMAFVRLFPRRTWRGERWRSWVGGGLGFVLTSGGMLLLTIVQDRPPRFLGELFGGYAVFIHYAGWFVLLSNAGLFLAWLIPSRRQVCLKPR